MVNRIGYAMLREALILLESGVADAETIDRSFRHAVGLWAAFAGPLRWVDLSGGPALYGKTMNNVLPTLSNATSITDSMRQMMENDDKGVVNGRGFYQYSPEDAKIWEERFRRSVWQVHSWAEELAKGRSYEQAASRAGHRHWIDRRTPCSLLPATERADVAVCEPNAAVREAVAASLRNYASVCFA